MKKYFNRKSDFEKEEKKNEKPQLTKEEVKIAEKIKFWEEQDKINQELIPRVIKNHELISELVIRIDEQSTIIGNIKDELNLIQISKSQIACSVEKEKYNNNDILNSLNKKIFLNYSTLGFSILALILSILSLIN